MKRSLLLLGAVLVAIVVGFASCKNRSEEMVVIPDSAAKHPAPSPTP